MKPMPLRLALAALSLTLARPALGLEDALLSSVVRIEVVKLVARKTSAGNFETSKESYIGSGFWAAGSNRIVTCWHVIEGAQQVDIYPYSAKSSGKSWSSKRGQVTLCAPDPAHDVAILQVPENGGGLPLATVIKEQVPITAVGHTEFYPWRVNFGTLTGKVSAKQIHISRVAGDVLVCDVNIGPGSSGGIVVDRDNQVLGMIEGGKERGTYTRIAVPSTVIRQALSALPGGPCQGGFSSAQPVVVNEETYDDLIAGGPPSPPEKPARMWTGISFGYLAGVDRFDDQVPTLRLGVLQMGTHSLGWSADVEVAQRSLDRTVTSGSLEVADAAEMKRFSVTAGPRLRLKELGRVALYSSVRAGFVHDQITHDYTFLSPLFAPQSYERPVSGGLGLLSGDAEVLLVTNLRIEASLELWQGSGGIGNGITPRLGLRAGFGHGSF